VGPVTAARSRFAPATTPAGALRHRRQGQLRNQTGGLRPPTPTLPSARVRLIVARYARPTACARRSGQAATLRVAQREAVAHSRGDVTAPRWSPAGRRFARDRGAGIGSVTQRRLALLPSLRGKGPRPVGAARVAIADVDGDGSRTVPRGSPTPSSTDDCDAPSADVRASACPTPTPHPRAQFSIQTTAGPTSSSPPRGGDGSSTTRARPLRDVSAAAGIPPGRMGEHGGDRDFDRDGFPRPLRRAHGRPRRRACR